MGEREKWLAWFDGACEPKNPGGYATWGFWVTGPSGEGDEGYGCAGNGHLMSNNVSEYSGAIGAMEWFLRHGKQNADIVVHGDNAMVVEQMNGKWRVAKEKPGRKPRLYIPFYQRAKALVGQFRSIRFQWIPRGENGKADDLSRRWLDEHGIRMGWRSARAKASSRPAFALGAAA